MPVVGNRIKVASSSTGTGNITLGSAEDGFQTFADGGISNNDVVRYVITEGSSFEIGKGTYLTSGPTLTRTSGNLLESSTGSLLNLGGSATVFVSLADVDVMQTDGGTFTGDVTFTGASYSAVWDKSDNALEFADSAQLRFGASSDLKIYHNATNSFIQNATGTLYIQNAATDADVRIRSDNGSGGYAEYIVADGSTGEAILYHYGSGKLATKSTGINVTGTVTADGLTVDGDATTNVDIKTSATNGTAQLRFSNDARIYSLGVEGSDSFFVYDATGASTRMIIDSSGNVGIGTTSPSEILHVKGGTGDHYKVRLEDSYGNTGLKFGQYGSNGQISSPSALEFCTGTSDTERMRIDSSGNVGIGRSAPSHPLHIGATSGNTILELQRTNTNSSGTVGAISFTASDDHSVAAIHATGDGDNEGAHLIFRTTSAASQNNYFNSTSERMRIDGSGNLLVGTTNANLYQANNDSTADNGFVWYEQYGFGTFSRNDNNPLILNRTGTDGDIVQFRKGGSTVGSIGTAGGDLLIHSSASSHVGLRLGEGYVLPTDNSGATSDAAADLGLSVNRFKDAYFSGTVTATSFSGDGSALTNLPSSGVSLAVSIALG